MKIDKMVVLKHMYDTVSIQNPAGPQDGGGGTIPIRLTPIQADFWVKSDALALKGSQDYAVKPRQVGMSTMLMCFIITVMVLYPGFCALWVSQDQKNALRIRRKWDLIVDSVLASPLSKLTSSLIKRRNDNELVLRNGSSIDFSFVGADENDAKGTGRGDTVHFAVFTESAYWNHAREAYNAMVPGMEHSDPSIVWDSTPNGTTGNGEFFYTRVMESLDGTLDKCKVHFWPWFKETRYSLPLGPGEESRIRNTMSSSEVRLVESEGLTIEQIKWRRQKINDLGSIEAFQETYPESMEEAFRTPGKTVFSVHAMRRDLNSMKAGKHKSRIDILPYLEAAGLEMGSDDILLCDTDNPKARKQARFYVAPTDSHRAPFYIGVDSSTGVAGSDPCGIHVMDAAGKKVAVISGVMTAHHTANTVARIALLYGVDKTIINIEDQSTGPEIRNLLCSEMSDRDIEKYGLHSCMKLIINANLEKNNVGTRPTIVTNLIASVDCGLIRLNDPLLYHQASTFIRHEDKDGKVEHANGAHDDSLFAMAMCLRARQKNNIEGGFASDMSTSLSSSVQRDSTYDDIRLPDPIRREDTANPSGQELKRAELRQRDGGSRSKRSSIFDLI